MRTEELNPAHLSVVVLKVAELEALLQFGLMPHPELIKSPFCLVQLRQQPGKEERGLFEKDAKYDIQYFSVCVHVD